MTRRQLTDAHLQGMTDRQIIDELWRAQLDGAHQEATSGRMYTSTARRIRVLHAEIDRRAETPAVEII